MSLPSFVFGLSAGLFIGAFAGRMEVRPASTTVIIILALMVVASAIYLLIKGA